MTSFPKFTYAILVPGFESSLGLWHYLFSIEGRMGVHLSLSLKWLQFWQEMHGDDMTLFNTLEHCFCVKNNYSKFIFGLNNWYSVAYS